MEIAILDPPSSIFDPVKRHARFAVTSRIALAESQFRAFSHPELGITASGR
jgi:hypothetical protein